MPVVLTQRVFGQEVDSTYTGPEEAWLVEHGYAIQEPPGARDFANATALDPDQDLTLAQNREEPGRAYDFDPGGVQNDPPTIDSLEPTTGAAAGGTVVTITGVNFEGVTGVNFGANAGTALDVVSDVELQVTTPAGTAGAVDVVVTNAIGSDTVVGGFTYQ